MKLTHSTSILTIGLLATALLPVAAAQPDADQILQQMSAKLAAAQSFSFITLSTVGYGDITPVSKVARMLAATEAMTGLLYVAVLIARLVGLYSTPKSS